METILKSRLAKYSSEDKDFKVSIMESEQSNHLVEILMKSNFMEGSRLLYSTETSYHEMKTIRDRAKRLISLVSVEKLSKITDSQLRKQSILDLAIDRDTLRIDKRIFSRIDLTSLVTGHFHSGGDMPDYSTSADLFQRLYLIQAQMFSSGRSNALFSADIKKIKFSKSSITIGRRSEEAVEWNPILNAEAEVVGTDLAFYSKDKWVHVVTHRKEKMNPKSWESKGGPAKDSYLEPVDLTSEDVRLVDIRIESRRGYLFLCLMLDGQGHPLTILCNDVPRVVSRVSLKRRDRDGRVIKNGLNFTREDLIELGIDQNQSEEIASMYLHSKGITSWVDDEPTDTVVDTGEDLFEMGDLGFEPDFSDFDLFDGPHEPGPPDDPGELEEELTSISVSVGSIEIRPRNTVLDSIVTSDSIKVRNDGTWQMSLPVRVCSAIYDSENPLSDLISEIKTNFEFHERMWVFAFIRSALLKNKELRGPVMREVSDLSSILE